MKLRDPFFNSWANLHICFDIYAILWISALSGLVNVQAATDPKQNQKKKLLRDAANLTVFFLSMIAEA